MKPSNVQPIYFPGRSLAAVLATIDFPAIMSTQKARQAQKQSPGRTTSPSDPTLKLRGSWWRESLAS